MRASKASEGTDHTVGGPGFDRFLGAVFYWRLSRELRAWDRAGHAPRLWWRDDDARRPSAALHRLMTLSTRYRIPLALAVIPDGELTALSQAISVHPMVSVIQHGCDHRDRNPGGGFSSEFSPATSAAEISRHINQAWARLAGVLAPIPIYAPPWNVLTPNARAAIAATPLRAVSLYGKRADADHLAEVNTPIDIMRWRPARFRGRAAILHRLWRQLRVRREAGRWREPIGLLTHHKNLDTAAWDFLEAFLPRMAGADRIACWRAAGELMGE